MNLKKPSREDLLKSLEEIGKRTKSDHLPSESESLQPYRTLVERDERTPKVPPPTLRIPEKRREKTPEEKRADYLGRWQEWTFKDHLFSEQGREVSALLSPINRKLKEKELSDDETLNEIGRLGFVIDGASAPSFDPTASIDWTPLQAIAWIATRSTDRVRDVSAGARQKTVRRIADATVLQFEIHWHASLRELDNHAELEAARIQLWGALRSGSITATGIDAPDVPRKIISAHEWTDDFCLLRDDTVHGNARRDGWFRVKDHGYFHVRLAVADVLKNWPNRCEASSGGSRRRPGNPGGKRKAVIEKMKLAVAGGYGLANAKGEEMAKKFGASRGTCEKAREEALSKSVKN